MKKQQIISRLPSLEEKHLGGYNWNGPGTKIMDRIGLSYKGKVGSKSFWLPVNKLDLAAFQHDLLYYNENNLVRAMADELYLRRAAKSGDTSDPSQIVSKAAIRFQQLTRKASYGAGVTLKVVPMWKTLDWIKKVLSTPYKTGAGSVAGYFLNPRSGRLPKGVKEVFVKLGMPPGGPTIRGNQAKFRQRVLKTIAYGVLSGGLYAGTESRKVKRLYNDIVDIFQESDEWTELKKHNDIVMVKYEDYLKTVGDFNAEGEFVVKDEIDSQKARRDYVNFFGEVEDYIEYTNREYGTTYAKPVLDTDELFRVSDPVPIPKVVEIELSDDTRDLLTSVSGVKGEFPLDKKDISQSIDKPQMNIMRTVEIGASPGLTGFASMSKSPAVPATRGPSSSVSGVRGALPSAPPPTATPVTPEQRIIILYNKFLKNDKVGYTELMKYGVRSSENARRVRRVIQQVYGFDTDSPLYIQDMTSGTRGRVLKNHFKTMAYLHQLDKVVDGDDYLAGGIAYNRYLQGKDPTGKTWLTDSKIKPFLDNTGHVKGSTSVPNYKKILTAVNKRRRVMGLPRIRAKSDKKADLSAALLRVRIPKMANVYNRYPHLERPEAEVKKRDLEKKLKDDPTSKEAFEVSSLGLTPEEHSAAIFKSVADQDRVKKLVKFDGAEMFSYPKYRTEFKSPGAVADTVKSIISDVVIRTRVAKVIDDLVKAGTIQNHKEARRDQVLQIMKTQTYTPKDYEDALGYLNDEGDDFVNDVHLSVTGSGQPLDIKSMEDTLTRINHVPEDALFAAMKARVIQYNDFEKKDIAAPLVKGMKAVDAPPDIRVLPKGVKITPVDAGDLDDARIAKKAEIADIKNALDTLREEKKKGTWSTHADLPDLIREEEKLQAELKSLMKAAPKTKSSRESKGGTVEAAHGSLRPHLRNPTKKAVEDVIGESPEQQMRDFKNWYVFDIPKDQTGQGTKDTNPLIKQNDARTAFMGQGTVFTGLDTFALTGGIDERKKFYVQHQTMTPGAIKRGFDDKRAHEGGEEAKFLATFNSDSNGLFTQDQTRAEVSLFKPIYQAPNDFFTGTLDSVPPSRKAHPFEFTTNRKLRVSEFKKNLNYFVD